MSDQATNEPEEETAGSRDEYLGGRRKQRRS